MYSTKSNTAAALLQATSGGDYIAIRETVDMSTGQSDAVISVTILPVSNVTCTIPCVCVTLTL